MKRLIGFVLCALVSGCSVSGDPQQVSIKHGAQQEVVGKLAAEKHCAKHKRTAKLLKISPAGSDVSSLFFKTRTSVYACVPSGDE